MIKNLVVLSFTLFSLTAGAAEQVQLPSNVIAQVRTFGGFGPPQLVGERGLRVFADGTVVSFNRNANPQQVLLARLSDQKLAQVRATADHVRLSRLQPLDANQPMCMDAPVTEYAVNTSRAGGMIIARQANCQRFADQEANASTLVEVLKGLQALAQLDGRTF